MGYCKSCGAYIPDGETECFACGARVAEQKPPRSPEREAAKEAAEKAAAEKAAAQRASGASASASASTGAKYEYKYEYNQGAHTAGGRRGADRYYSSDKRGPERQAEKQDGPERFTREYSDDAEENKNLGVLCYLGPLLLIPLLTKPDSSFLRYHCNQGLVLLIFCVICSVLHVVPVVGWMMGAVGWIIGIMGFFRGLKNVQAGKRSPLPYIGGITILK